MRRAFKPFLRKKAGLAIMTGLLLFGGALLNWGPFNPTAANAQARLTPYVVETETYFFDEDPGGRLSVREMEARRSDGTVATVATNFLPNGHHLTLRHIVYPNGREIQLIDALSIKTTWPLAGRPAETRVAHYRELTRHNCVEPWEALLRYDVVFGQRVAVVKTEPVEMFGTTWWRDPDLDCMGLQYRTESFKAGRFRVMAERRVVRFKLVEPEAKLFDEGANYAELRPSEMLRRATKAEGIPWDAKLQELAKREDERYTGMQRQPSPPRQRQ